MPKETTFPADLSMVMPCYNEEDILGYTLEKLVSAFNDSEYQLELIAVDNGSNDSTGDIIKKFSEKSFKKQISRFGRNIFKDDIANAIEQGYLKWKEL